MNGSAFLLSTAPIRPWNGDPRIFWTIPELRAMGMGWKQIESDAMTREVLFDEKDKQK